MGDRRGVYAAGTLIKEECKMIYAQHFSAEEFREWSDDMSPRLITMLDVLRFRIGRPITISASEYAFGHEKIIKE